MTMIQYMKRYKQFAKFILIFSQFQTDLRANKEHHWFYLIVILAKIGARMLRVSLFNPYMDICKAIEFILIL